MKRIGLIVGLMLTLITMSTVSAHPTLGTNRVVPVKTLHVQIPTNDCSNPSWVGIDTERYGTSPNGSMWSTIYELEASSYPYYCGYVYGDDQITQNSYNCVTWWTEVYDSYNGNYGARTGKSLCNPGYWDLGTIDLALVPAPGHGYDDRSWEYDAPSHPVSSYDIYI